MPVYDFNALDAVGKKQTGVIEGDNLSDAKERLRAQGILVTHIEEKNRKASAKKISLDSLLAFTIQLSQLVGAGIAIYDSLLTIEQQYRGDKIHPVILSLTEQIKGGKSLSDAMEQHPECFDRLYCAMIKAGESSGSLESVLQRAVEHLKKQSKLRKQIANAMIYPAVLGLFSLIVIIVLLTFVVPSIEAIFSNMELNAFTQSVLSVSHFFQQYWWLYIPVTAALVFYLAWFFRSEKGKHYLQKTLLKVPVIKNLVINASLARFSRTMATLQEGGVTMIDSMRIAKETMYNVSLEAEIERAEERIVEGAALSEEMQRSPYFPLAVSRMVAVAEETGKAADIFNRIADIYEDEVEKAVDRTMALMQPVILIIMGALIGIILLSILLPLTDVSSLMM